MDAVPSLPVDAIRQIVCEYLLEHPEVLVEVQQALRAKQEAEEEEKSRQAIARLRDRIFADPEAPVAGTGKPRTGRRRRLRRLGIRAVGHYG